MVCYALNDYLKQIQIWPVLSDISVAKSTINGTDQFYLWWRLYGVQYASAVTGLE
jgi:hypothetical protein